MWILQFAWGSVVLPSLIMILAFWLLRIPSPFPRRVWVISHKDFREDIPTEVFQTRRRAERVAKQWGPDMVVSEIEAS